MSQMGTLEIPDSTGKVYEFLVFPLTETYRPVGGVYVFTKEYIDYSYSPPKVFHDLLYLGQTGNLANRHNSGRHEKLPCVKRFDVNRLCIYPEESEFHRLRIEKALIQRWRPECNTLLKVRY